MSKGSLNIGLYQGRNTELSFVLGVSDDFEVSLDLQESAVSSRSAYGLKGRILSETKDSIGLVLGDQQLRVCSCQQEAGYWRRCREHLGVSFGANPGPLLQLRSCLIQ